MQKQYQFGIVKTSERGKAPYCPILSNVMELSYVLMRVFVVVTREF
jgi:hypothetical protein